MDSNQILLDIPNNGEEDEEEVMKEEHLSEVIGMEDTVLEVVKLNNLSTSSKSVSKKRNSLTISSKINIIQRHEKGESAKNLALEFKVGRTTIGDILKKKHKFLNFVTSNTDATQNLKRRRTLRRTVHQDLEDRLFEWYNQIRDSGKYVSGPMIATKAQELHKELGYTDNFSASNGWLDRFKLRYGIKICGLREFKKTEGDVNAIEPFKIELDSLAQWYNLSLEQIYNADECDLFWRMLPNPTQDDNEVKSSIRVYRERLTVLCCTNATGSHKLKLVCIGRGQRVRTFTTQEVKNLSVNYYSQETAWMDSDIFKNWFHSVFCPAVRLHLAQQGLPENALLLIDRNSSHPDEQQLRSSDNLILVQYFPAKVKSLIQPMEQGIIRDMKLLYRYQILTELISKNMSINEFYSKFKVKDGINHISQAWDQISAENIQKCFSKIFPLQEEATDNHDSNIPNLEAFMNLIAKIPECVENNYNIERLKFWLGCDEAEPIRDRNSLSPLKMENESMKIFEEIAPTQIISQAIDIKNLTDIQEIVSDEQIINDDTEIYLQNETFEHEKHSEEEEFLYEETIVNEVTCEQAIDAMEVVLNFMKNDSESRYRDVVFLTELKKKLKRRLVNLVNTKEEKN